MHVISLRKALALIDAEGPWAAARYHVAMGDPDPNPTTSFIPADQAKRYLALGFRDVDPVDEAPVSPPVPAKTSRKKTA